MNWLRRQLWLVLALAVALLAGRMLLTSQHFYTHDDIQVFRLHEFVQCIHEGQIPCRWASDLGKGYGYPWFNYYPPMIYVIPALLHLAGVSLITSLNLFMFMTFILAAWSMYLLAKELVGSDELAFLASILFTLYPFHAINVFVRGVYAENLAWSFAPILLLLVYQQTKANNLRKWIPVAFAFLFLTHVISTFILTTFVLGWTLVTALVHKQNILSALIKVAVQVAIGICIAAFFFVPAMAEKGLVQSDSLTQGYFAYTNHYVSFFQLFKEYKWNYEGSMWNEAPDEMPFMVGHIHTSLLIVGLIIIAFFRVARKNLLRETGRLYLALASLIASTLCLLLAHFKSDPIWAHIPQLAYVQFPWRFVVWAGIPLILTNILLLSYLPAALRRSVVMVAALALLVYSYPFFFPKSYDKFSDADLVSGAERHEQQVKSLYDYLPVTVKQVPDKYADEMSGTSKTFYFPGWSASVNGIEVPIEPDPENGLIRSAQPVNGTLVLSWHETPFRLAMDLVSLISVVGYGFYLWKSHVQ